jgi:hypothetical protein
LTLGQVRRSFSYLDKNKTGTLNREDLRHVFRDIGIALDKKHELALMQVPPVPPPPRPPPVHVCESTLMYAAVCCGVTGLCVPSAGL